eukprot:6141203-Prymnesium_polylepis.1
MSTWMGPSRYAEAPDAVLRELWSSGVGQQEHGTPRRGRARRRDPMRLHAEHEGGAAAAPGRCNATTAQAAKEGAESVRQCVSRRRQHVHLVGLRVITLCLAPLQVDQVLHVALVDRPVPNRPPAPQPRCGRVPIKPPHRHASVAPQQRLVTQRREDGSRRSLALAERARSYQQLARVEERVVATGIRVPLLRDPWLQRKHPARVPRGANQGVFRPRHVLRRRQPRRLGRTRGALRLEHMDGCLRHHLQPLGLVDDPVRDLEGDGLIIGPLHFERDRAALVLEREVDADAYVRAIGRRQCARERHLSGRLKQARSR